MARTEGHPQEALVCAARYASEVRALRERLGVEREGYKLALILLLCHGRHAERCRVWKEALAPCSCGWHRVRDDAMRERRERYDPATDGPWPRRWTPAS